MANHEEEIQKQVGELGEKMKLLKAKQALVFSSIAVVEFCRGFDSPVIGSLAYLQQNTTTHQSIECVTSCNQINEHTITNHNNYYDFASELTEINPPIGVDFTFKLTKSVYNLGDISETFSVYFRNGEYEIVYGDFRLTKKYMSHIEPDETRELRNLICGSIFNKVAQKIDELE